MKRCTGVLLQDFGKEQKVMIDSVRMRLKISGEDVEIVLLNEDDKVVNMKLKGEMMQEILCSDIVYIQSVKGDTGTSSNNKEVFFAHRSPGILVDFTMSKDLVQKLHVASSDFVEINRGISVNRRYIRELNNGKELVVQCINHEGKQEVRNLPISRRKYLCIRELLCQRS